MDGLQPEGAEQRLPQQFRLGDYRLNVAYEPAAETPAEPPAEPSADDTATLAEGEPPAADEPAPEDDPDEPGHPTQTPA